MFSRCSLWETQQTRKFIEVMFEDSLPVLLPMGLIYALNFCHWSVSYLFKRPEEKAILQSILSFTVEISGKCFQYVQFSVSRTLLLSVPRI